MLSFVSPVETDTVRRFPTSPKVFVLTSNGNRTRDLPHGNRTLCHIDARDGFRGSALCASIPFLFFSLLLCLSFFPLSLALVYADPVEAGVGFRVIINKYIYLFIYLFIYILLKSSPSRQHSKVLYRWGIRRREQTGNHSKVGVKRK